jgi:hypothetical protein
MRLKVIACEVLRRELYHAASRARHPADVALLPQGLHDNSDTCRRRLQDEVDAADPGRYDAVLLGYGLCNNAMAGVQAGRLPLVVPRAHDCITLLLGSKERYRRLFDEAPGTYWFSSGWLEYAEKSGEPIAPRPNSGLGPVCRADFDDLVARYGEENARYLSDFMAGWEAEYTRGALIRFPFDAHLGLEARVRDLCRQKGWEYVEVEGDLGLLEAGLGAADAAAWDDERFLTVRPGEAVRASFDDAILLAAPAGTAGPGEPDAGRPPAAAGREAEADA